MSEEEVVIVPPPEDIWSQFFQDCYKKPCNKLNRNFPFTRSLVIDIGDIPQTLFNDLVADPVSTIKAAYGGLKISRLVKNWDGDTKSLNIRFMNHPQKVKIRELSSSKVGKFVSFEGVVRRVHTTKPSVIEAEFQCPCGRRQRMVQTGRDLQPPVDECGCGRKRSSWKLMPERCRTIDVQTVIVQESHDNVDGSEVPAAVAVVLSDDICKKVNAGNRVIVTGVLRTFQQKPTDIILDVDVEASFVEVLDKEFYDVEITDEEEQEILALANDPDSWDKITRSIVPSVYGCDDLKEGVALQLFGGVSGYNDDGTWQRGDIHILMVGDPGIAKSKLMNGILAICPRGVKTSGKGSSKAGLTAAAVSDGNGGWTLDAGAIVLADRGMLIIDEMDKMEAHDRSAMHDGMEQQEVPINKAGINTTLKSRCSILAAANPVNGRFDDYEDLAGQFNLPPTLLSRFDLIFICRDVVDAATDAELAMFILSRGKKKSDTLTPDFLKKYIGYAKKMCSPELSAAARDALVEFYVKLRSLGGEGKPMPITPRQLEGLLRLSQASARARLSPKIEKSDALKAIRMVETCLRHVAYDPETSVFDIDRVCSPMSKQKRDIMTELKATIIEKGSGDPVYLGIILEEMERRGFATSKVEKIMEEGYINGAFTEPRRGYYKVV